jgi:hypothetical protein
MENRQLTLCRDMIVVYWVTHVEHTKMVCKENPVVNCQTGSMYPNHYGLKD